MNRIKAASSASSGMALAALLLAAAPAQAEGLRAVAELGGCENPDIKGTVTFVEQVTKEGIKEVVVEMNVTGLTDGKHAVHIHETANCTPCAAAGGHHDPGPFGESRPDTATDDKPAKDVNHPFHMGDLINVEVKDGVGHMKHVTNRVTLSPGRLSVFDEDGSSIIIHTYHDTYCDHEETLHKGCAGGPRDACGIIKLVEG
jgi:superoxide dismutase, Cu-Zn family